MQRYYTGITQKRLPPVVGAWCGKLRVKNYELRIWNYELSACGRCRIIK